MNDLISRREAITIPILPKEHRKYQTMNLDDAYELGWFDCQKCVEDLPSTQPERDIPMKPNETIDSAWGIRKKQAVCPKCDYYLPRIYFLGYSKNEKVTYCETCGQAINWEGWEWEE